MAFADIPADVWRSVASRLDPPSLMCFRQTCSAWRIASVGALPEHYLFFLSDDPLRDVRRLFTSDTSAPDLRCCGSFEDWLVLVTPSRRLVVLRQFPTQTIVELPDQFTLPNSLPISLKDFYKGSRYVRKVTLSAAPTSADCTAMAIFGQYVAVCQPGDMTWTVVNPDYKTLFYSDGAFAGGEFYLTGQNGQDLKTEVLYRTAGDQPWALRISAIFEELDQYYQSKRLYLMDFKGRLMAAVKIRGRSRNVIPDSTKEFHVFEMDGTGQRLERVAGIGERAILVSTARSVCVSTEEFPSLEGNSVYFMKPSELETGIYSMGDGSIKWLEKESRNIPLFLYLFRMRGLEEYLSI